MTPCFGIGTIRSRDKSRSQFSDKTSSLNEKNIRKQYSKKEHNEYHDISSCFEQLPFHVTSVERHRRVSGFISPHPPSQGPCELEQKNDVDDCDESENLI